MSGQHENDAADFLFCLAKKQGIFDEIRLLNFTDNKPTLFCKLCGEDDALPGVLLTGHYDVVPVGFGWSVDPFGGFLHENGRIFGRGAQDMKSVLIQYIFGLKKIFSENNVKLKRSIYVTMFPDEEIGGLEGAKKFVESEMFNELKIGVCLDEGLANPGNCFNLFYGERAQNIVRLRTRGPAGHGSRFIRHSAVEKLVEISGKIYSYRSSQESLCNCNVLKKLGEVTTVNITGLKAGVESKGSPWGIAANIVPSEAELIMDVRVPLTETRNIRDIVSQEFLNFETGDCTDLEILTETRHPETNRNLEEVIWRNAIVETLKAQCGDSEVELSVFPAATDSRHFRNHGVLCFGFSPLRNTPILLHDKDEYVDTKVFLEGIDIYENLIRTLANM